MLALSEMENVMLPGEEGKKEEEPKIQRIVEFDKEWLKDVLSGICPQCEGPLTKTGILRRCTTNNHLHIYGNPVLVAYKREKRIHYPPIKYDKCPECQNTAFIEDEDKHETTCKNCGLVLKGPYEFGIDHPFHDNFEETIYLQ